MAITRGFSMGGSTLTSIPASSLAPDQTPTGTNVDPARFAVAAKRTGYSRFDGTTGIPVAGTIRGLHVWERTTSATHVLATIGGKIYEVSGTSWTDRTQAAVTYADTHTRFAALNGFIITANSGVANLQRWNGTDAAFVNTTANPASNLTLLAVHNQRLFAAGADDMTVYFSALNDPNVWATPDGGSFVVGGRDGDRIIAMIAAYGYIYVFKRWHVYQIDFRGSRDFDVIDLGVGFGALNSYAVWPYKGGVVFASERGLHYLNPSTLEDLHPYVFWDWQDVVGKSTTVVAVDREGRIHFCYDSNNDGTNDRSFVYYEPAGRVHPWTNQNNQVFATRNNGQLLSGQSTAIRINQYDGTQSDDGTAITMSWDTPDLSFPSPDSGNPGITAKAHVTRCWLRARATTGGSPVDVTVNQIVEGKDEGQVGTMSLVASDASHETVTKMLALKLTPRGRYIRLRFAHVNTNQRCELYEYAIEGMERQERE